MRSLLTSPVPSLAPCSAWLRLQQSTTPFRCDDCMGSILHCISQLVWLQTGPACQAALQQPVTHPEAAQQTSGGDACLPHTDTPA